MRHFENLNEHVFEPETCGPSQPMRVPRIPGRYAGITLVELCSGRWDDVFSAKARLYLYLNIISVRGAREVHMTNEAAASIRVHRNLKYRYLEELEAAGIVAIRRNGHEAAWVRVLKLA